MSIRIAILAVVLAAVGCKSASAPAPTSKTPANIAAVVEDIGRAQVELKAALPLITEPIPKTHVEAAVGHLNEATQDGGAAFKQAEKDGKAYANVVAENQRLKNNDPAKKFLYLVSGGLLLGAFVLGLIAYFFTRPKLYEVAAALGFLACVCVGAARFIGAIEITGIVIAGAVVATGGYFVVRWFMAQHTTANIIQSIEAAKKKGALVLDTASKAIINKVQTKGTKAVVAKIVAAEKAGVII